MHHDGVRRFGHADDRLEIFHDVVIELGLHARQHRVRRNDHQHGVTVGRRFRADRGADRAVAARPVVDLHRLAPFFGQLPGDDTREQVGAAAGRESHYHADGARGVLLCEYRRRRERNESSQQNISHSCLPVINELE